MGAEAIKSINCFNFTKAFMGANGIDIGSGFTTPDIEEGLIKETAINKSYMAFVLADHSKFRRVYSVTFAPLQKCCIITDKLPTPDFSQATVIKEVKMIYTVTLNPSIDYIVRLDSLVPGITNRTTAEEYYYGGKGINVSCVLAELDLESTAFGFVAGFTGDAIERVFATTGLSPTLLSLKVEFQEST